MTQLPFLKELMAVLSMTSGSMIRLISPSATLTRTMSPSFTSSMAKSSPLTVRDLVSLVSLTSLPVLLYSVMLQTVKLTSSFLEL